MTRVVILGAGPAGLGAAWQLRKRGKAHALVFERRDEVGGNAGSFELAGIPVDYGSHRLHPACQPDILDDLRTLLGADLLARPRHGRIRLGGRWIHFPLQPFDLLRHLPWSFGAGVAGDTVGRLFTAPNGPADSFAGVLSRGLGKTICREFYFPYAAKIWGLPPEELSATQARRRVPAGSLSKMLRRVLAHVPGLAAPDAGRFFYPRHGYGQISGALADAARNAGAEIHLRSAVRQVSLGAPGRGAPHRLEVEADGTVQTVEADWIWSTIPLPAFVQLLSPALPPEVQAARTQVTYRAMVLIYLVVALPQFTEFDTHYFPAADVPLTRLSEPKNYTGRSQPAGHTVLCAELPCEVDDAVWNASDAALGETVRESLARCGLDLRAPILQVTSKRLAAAYPIYRRGYEAPFARLDEWVATLDRVLTFGRQGLFAHDNTHHTLEMAYAAVDCLDPAGAFDRTRWQQYRTEFEAHVVED